MSETEFIKSHNVSIQDVFDIAWDRGETIRRLACRVQLLELQLQSLIWAAYIPLNMTSFLLDHPTDHRVLGNELKSAEALLGDKS